jgi:hypothetical protein
MNLYCENMYDNIYNYLIDKDIIIDDKDIFINKLKYFLLKYKRIIAIILLIILLFIGYNCNLIYLDFDLYQDNQIKNKNIDKIDKIDKNISGGYKADFTLSKSKVLPKLGAAAKSAGSSIKSGAKTALSAAKPKNIYKFGERRAEDAKALAPRFYSFLYSIALTALAFLIFVPTIGFLIVGIICYSLLRSKIGYIKSL